MGGILLSIKIKQAALQYSHHSKLGVSASNSSQVEDTPIILLIISFVVETQVVVFHCFPLLGGHFEGVGSVDHKCHRLGQFFVGLDEPIGFVVPLEDEAGQDEGECAFLVEEGPAFGVADSPVAVQV